MGKQKLIFTGPESKMAACLIVIGGATVIVGGGYAIFKFVNESIDFIQRKVL